MSLLSLNNKYVLFDIIVNSIIRKLISKHTYLKKYTNWAKLSSLVLREWEETKTKYFAPQSCEQQLNHSNKLLYLIPFFRCASPINCKVTEINENNLAGCSDVDTRIWSGSTGMICCAKKDIKVSPKQCSSFDGRR